jgi:hypothetical protein
MGNSLVNNNGGYYESGKKLTPRAVVDIIENFEKMRADGTPTIKVVAKLSKVSEPTASKYIKIYEELGVGSLVEYLGRSRAESSTSGPGSQTLDSIGVGLLMNYYYANPSATLDMYQVYLRHHGFSVSNATLSRVFLTYDMRRGKPNMIPFDKWSDRNFVNLYDYLEFIQNIHWSRLHFFDECHHDGRDVFCRKVRRDPITGLFPDVGVPGNFRVRYNVFASCTAAPHNGNWPVQSYISTDNGDAAGYAEFVMDCAHRGCYARYSVGVIDNAAIHTGEVGDVLSEWLWNFRSPHHNFEPLRMILVPLPTRYFELNPQELVFAFSTKKMLTYDISQLAYPENAVVDFTYRSFSECTHHHVRKFFQHCGYGRE